MYGLLTEETKLINITGKITDSKSKKPIPDAKVYIITKKDNSKGSETKSDMNGDYKFENLTLDSKTDYNINAESDTHSYLSAKVNTNKENQIINFSLVEKNIYSFSGTVSTDISDDFYDIGLVENADVSITAGTETIVSTKTDKNGKYQIKDIKLDKNKVWGIRARATNRQTTSKKINLKIFDQTFDFVLEQKSLEEVPIVQAANSTGTEYATFLNLNIKSENGNPIKEMSVDVFYEGKKLKPLTDIKSNNNGEIKNMVFLSNDNEVLKKFEESSDGKKIYDRSAREGEITVVYKKRKFSQSVKYTVKLQNKKLYWESHLAKKIEKIDGKDKTTKEGEFISLPYSNVVLDKKDLKLYLNLDETKNGDKTYIDDEIMKKGGFNHIESKTYNSKDIKNKINYYINNKSEDNNLTITLDNVLDFDITVFDKNKKTNLSNTLVKVAYDKEMTDVVLFERTNNSGNLNGSVELISESDESGKTFKKRKIWVELRQPGFNVYKESFNISPNDNSVKVYLDDTEPIQQNQTLDNTFNKKSNYFVFYGKTDQDYKFRSKNEEDALYFAKKDALEQYLDLSKYGRYREYFKEKVPPGGEIVYERDDNGFYFILKFSRFKLRKFVRKTIPSNVLNPTPVEKQNLKFTNNNVGEVLEEIKTNGKYITVFMFVSDINVQTIINKYPKMVNELNTNSYTYRINNTNDKNYGTLSNILNTSSKQSISIVAGTSDVRMSQSIYSALDLQKVAEYIEKISD